MTQLFSDRKLSSEVLSIKTTPPSDMVTFFAIPGASGKVRLKLEMPEDAHAVMIRYKTTAWADGDGIATGTLVDTLTDNYNLANEWYEVSGLTNGTAYYFKAFPLNGAYNTTIGENETVSKAGGLVSEYTFDDVSGSTVYDSVGDNDMTMYNGSTITGKVGNAGRFNGTSAYGLVSKSACPSGAKTITFLVLQAPLSVVLSDTDSSASGGVNCLIQHQANYSIELVHKNSGSTYFVCNSSEALPSDGGFHMITFTYDGTTDANGAKVYFNTTLKSTATATNATPITSSKDIYVNRYSNIGYDRDLQIDQLRFYDRALEDYELANIYNGGDGC